MAQKTPKTMDDTESSVGTTVSWGSASEDESTNLIGNQYQKLEDLGVGGYSRVILASDIKSNELVAIKILLSEPKKIINAATKEVESIEWTISESKVKQCKREIGLMQKINHPNVVKLVKLIENSTFPGKDELTGKLVDTPCLCVILEYCPCGELFDYLMYAGGLGSRVTRTYFHQFLNGLNAMHDAGYVHRDLKPENLLLDENYNLKIADFGFATPFKDQNGKRQLTTTCGTRGYLAPELIRGEKYTEKVDMFALGIIMFTTFAGFPPFQHAGRGDWWWDKMEKAWTYWQQASLISEDSDANKQKKAERISKGNQKMKLFWSAHERSCKFSDQFKHLMQYLLNPNPNIRYDIENCRNHNWLKGKTLSAKQLRKTMKKLNNKVTQQRALKIREQLKQRDMIPQSGPNKNVKRTSTNEQMFVTLANEWSPMLKDSKNIKMLKQQRIMLQKARFQIISKTPLATILETIEEVALKYMCKVEHDSRKCEYLIKASITRIRQGKELFPRAERVCVKVMLINEKNVLSDEEDSKEDEIDEDDNFIVDSDNEVEDDSKNENENDENVSGNTASNNNNTNDTSTNNNEDRWILVFWRVDGSADGFQKLMAEIFYDEKMNSLMDLNDVLNNISNEKELLSMKKAPLAFDNVFAAATAKLKDSGSGFATLAESESDNLPHSQPIPLMD